MTAEEFVRLMMEHKVEVKLLEGGRTWRVAYYFQRDGKWDMSHGDASDPIEAMEKLAEKRGWVE